MTGVQTCALPIWAQQHASHDAEHRRVGTDAEREGGQRDDGERPVFAGLAQRDGQVAAKRLPELAALHPVLGRWREGGKITANVAALAVGLWTSFAMQGLGFW